MMALLDDLARYLADHTSMTVHEAVLLMSSEDDLPRARLTRKGLSRHSLFRAPAGLFFCDLHADPDAYFFAEMAEGRVDVGELERLDPKTTLRMEENWPSKKIEIGGRYYVLPRNHAGALAELLAAAPTSRRRR
jgi:hypothetical protein